MMAASYAAVVREGDRTAKRLPNGGMSQQFSLQIAGLR